MTGLRNGYIAVRGLNKAVRFPYTVARLFQGNLSAVVHLPHPVVLFNALWQYVLRALWYASTYRVAHEIK